MDIVEAKARACCNTIDEIFEKSYNCKIPQELKDEHLRHTLEFFGKLKIELHKIMETK